MRPVLTEHLGSGQVLMLFGLPSMLLHYAHLTHSLPGLLYSKTSSRTWLLGIRIPRILLEKAGS